MKNQAFKELKTNTDTRGSFTELMRSDWEITKNFNFKQAMLSTSKSGIIRAWHKHINNQNDYLIVIQGKAKIVYVSEDESSFHEINADSNNLQLIFVPGNCWHGTQALTKTTTVYFVNQLYNYNKPDELRLPYNHLFKCGRFNWEISITDEEYRKKRNDLIPNAIVYAYKKAGLRPTTNNKYQSLEVWAANWNRLYLSKMDELAKLNKLI